MKITKGFAAVTPEGEFLSFYWTETHTGRRFHCSAVASIDNATVWHAPYLTQRGADMPPGTRWVPVSVRHEVVLEGYGVEKQS